MDVSPVAAGAGASPPPPSEWGSVPAPLLSIIFRRVLENYDTAEAIARHWTNLATVCQAWLDAARLTPLCLHLAEPARLSDPRVRSWLSKATLEVLVINRNAANAHQIAAAAAAGTAAATVFDQDLFSRPETAATSESTLEALINASLGAAPLLRPFNSLRQLSLFTPVFPAPAGPETVDAAALAALTQLSCLTLAGHVTVPDFAPLPPSLKHLSLSLHVRDHVDGVFFSGKAQTVALPPHLTDLEFLAIKANYLVVSWENLLTQARQIHLSANYLGLTSSKGKLHDPGSFAKSLADSPSTAECAVLAFHRLGLYPPEAPPPQELRPAAGDVDLDFFLEVVRERAMTTWDMDPVMDAPPSFVNDVAPIDECFCLTLERQEPGEPRSYHFTTPLSDAEVTMLRQQPAWRLVWCRDPRTAEVLADPRFVAVNAPHLNRLSRCWLPEGVDLRAFTALRSLHCELAGSIPSVHFPSGLTSLELEVPQLEVPVFEGFEDLAELIPPQIERRKFSARTLAPLRVLRDLALAGWHRADLADLAPSVTSVRLLNPLTVTPDGSMEVLGEQQLRLPRSLMPAASAAALDAQRALRVARRASVASTPPPPQSRLRMLEEEAQGAPEWSDDEWSNDDDVDVDGGDGVEADESDAMEVDAAAGASQPRHGSPMQQQAQGEAAEMEEIEKRRQRRRMPHHDNDIDEHAHLAYALIGHDDDLYDTSPGDDDSHKGGGAAGADAHGRTSCGDPNCPIHSGKPHLQLTFSDARTEIPIDLSYILASGFPMISLTLDAAPEAAAQGVYMFLTVGPSWTAFVQALKASKVEVLEINHHRNGVAWVPHAEAGPEERHHYLWEGLQALQEELSDVFDFKTWDGLVSQSRLVKEGLCYALVRKRGNKGGSDGGSDGGGKAK